MLFAEQARWNAWDRRHSTLAASLPRLISVVGVYEVASGATTNCETTSAAAQTNQLTQPLCPALAQIVGVSV